MSRSKWKPPFFKKEIFKKFLRKKNYNFNKASTIFPKFLGKTLSFYTGQKFDHLTANGLFIGFCFGEFIGTRKKYWYQKN